ncbi:MAG: hypothetical protein D6726_03410, partial [Nitrospirae bacterium]
MTIRSKLSLFLVGFLLITLLFGGGAFLVFDNLKGSMELMERVVYEHDVYEKLKLSIANYASNVKGWAYTGKQAYRNRYDQLNDEIIKNFGEVSPLTTNEERMTKLGRDF